jgi:transcriptional regulator with XRE-family HTH domain
MNLIGNNIKIIRKQIGLTQEELALHIGVTPQAVSRWENGTGMPDISMVVPLAKTLNVSTDYLFGLEKNEITRKICTQWRLFHGRNLCVQ